MNKFSWNNIKNSIKLVSPFCNRLSKSFNLKERIIIFSALLLFMGSLVWILITFYFSKTKVVPAHGGIYVEGIVGKPEYLNPVLAQTNKADQDLSNLIYSGLMKYDKNNKLVNDVVENWQISEDKTKYVLDLRKDIFFHDGEPLTAEDALFTLNIIQNPRYKSPLRLNWTGVSVEVTNPHQILFTLKKPFVPFLHNLTFGILPKHLWKDIEPEDFPLSTYNKSPIGSGPFEFVRLDPEENQITLKAYEKYHLGQPNIETALFKFFPTEQEAITALNNDDVSAIDNLTHSNIDLLTHNNIKLYEITLPLYYALFFNEHYSKIIAIDEVREALAFSTCKEDLIDEVLHGKGTPIYSPVLTTSMDDIDGFEKRGCDTNKAKEILEKAGYELKKYEINNEGEFLPLKEEEDDEDDDEEDEDDDDDESEMSENSESATDSLTNKPEKIYFKNNDPLVLTITLADFPELITTAELIQKQWEQIGIYTDLEVLSIGDLNQSKIETQEYEILLHGETLEVDPDPRPYWHSAERKTGNNLSNYENKEVDKLLDSGREEVNEDVRDEIYREFQLIINKDIPAIFLYSPSYLYPVNKEIKGIYLKSLGNTSKRYSDVINWYVEEQRVKK
jgi:peptide/nickel transport system substrate-binding protein